MVSSMALPNVWNASDASESDIYLVEKALDGEIAAYEKLVSRYQNKI